MNRRVGFSRLAPLGPCLAVAALLTWEPRLHAEDKTEDYSKGTHVFRLILQKSRLEITTALSKDDAPDKSIVVILGDPAGLNQVPGDFDEFLRRGGAILFASDWRTMDSPLKWYGIRITGDLFGCSDSEKTYRGSKACPFVVPTKHDQTGLFADLPDAVMGSGNRLATNLPSILQPDDALLWVFGLSKLANLPDGCSRLDSKGELGQRFQQELPLAVGGPIGRQGGRLLVIADHSIFINLMMQQTDNGNLQFGFRVASWLNESGKRKKVLFIEDGVPQSGVKLEQLQALPTPPEIPKPSMNALVGKANEFLANLEYYDELNQFLADKFPPRWLIRWLLILLTVLLVWYGFVRSRRSRHRVDPSEPLLASAVKRAKPNASAIELRHQSLVDAGNLWEPARFLARQFFEAALGLALVSPAPGRVRLPPFQIKLGGLRGWLLGQRVRRLWRFAHQPLPQPVTIRQFRKLARKVADLKDAVAQGRIRFSSTPQPSVAR
jgi:hypothetical protein